MCRRNTPESHRFVRRQRQGRAIHCQRAITTTKEDERICQIIKAFPSSPLQHSPPHHHLITLFVRCINILHNPAMSASRILSRTLASSALQRSLTPPTSAFRSATTTTFHSRTLLNNITNINNNTTKRNFSATMSTSTGVHNLTT